MWTHRLTESPSQQFMDQTGVAHFCHCVLSRNRSHSTIYKKIQTCLSLKCFSDVTLQMPNTKTYCTWALHVALILKNQPLTLLLKSLQCVQIPAKPVPTITLWLGVLFCMSQFGGKSKKINKTKQKKKRLDSGRWWSLFYLQGVLSVMLF